MLIRQIQLREDAQVNAGYISDNNEIKEVLDQFEISMQKRVVVLVGGAGGIGFTDNFAMRKAVGIMARLAEKIGATIVDGGTQAGIMTEIGKQRKRNRFSFPLIGVVFDSLLLKQEPKNILESNHTCFIFIPGNDWGAESS